MREKFDYRIIFVIDSIYETIKEGTSNLVSLSVHCSVHLYSMYSIV